MRAFKIVMMIGVFSIGLFAFSLIDQSSDWEIPAKYQKMTNPTNPKDAEN